MTLRRPYGATKLAICCLILLSLARFSAAEGTSGNTTDSSTPSQETLEREDNAESLYGFGVRLGIYFQALAFLIGFANVLCLDPKSQFSGVVIAFTILVRWFSRLNEHNISTAELWVALALLMLVSAPGMWLLFFTLEAQRRKWYRKMRDKKAAFAEVTKGQTLNILQALLVFLWTVVANSWFSYWIIAHDHGASYPPEPGSRNVIWLGVTTSVGSTWVKFFMITQAALSTLFTAVPAFLHLFAIGFAIKSYWYPRERPESPLLNTADELDKKTRLETKRWAFTFGTILFLLCLGLLLSVELTLKEANLTPAANVQDPGQLLPLIAGAVSCVSSAAEAFGKTIPKKPASRPIATPPIVPFTSPFAAPRSSRRGNTHYIPLEDVPVNSYQRTPVVASPPVPNHRRVGSEVGTEGYNEVTTDALPRYDSNADFGGGYGLGSPPLGRNSRYEPMRRRL